MMAVIRNAYVLAFGLVLFLSCSRVQGLSDETTTTRRRIGYHYTTGIGMPIQESSLVSK